MSVWVLRAPYYTGVYTVPCRHKFVLREDPLCNIRPSTCVPGEGSFGGFFKIKKKFHRSNFRSGGFNLSFSCSFARDSKN